MSEERDATPTWRIEAAHLSRARRIVARHAIRTPLVPATALGTRAWLKLETQQHTGAFKVRGALARLDALSPEERAGGVVAASAGNHGLGLAWAGRRLGVRVRVFVPRTAPLLKRQGMAALGAEVVIADADGYDGAEEAARAAADEDGVPFVSPFDDPWVAAGNGATIADEIELTDLEAVVAPVGGGGLLAGLAAGFADSGRDVRLFGVQSEASPAMHRSIETGAAIERMDATDTLAEGLEGGVSKTSFALVRDAVERVDLVTEAAIADAMRFAHERLGLVVEGSAATTIAWARAHLDDLPGGGAVVLVVTGRNVDRDKLGAILFGRPDD